ncbi:MAG: hypothetical protein GF317_02475 [Candidatus Lokiarchaeota archaeon]|nr:hypothetical protein [Candidatus Lokiarchaeota archaeon]MBD3198772.1 hypothetical protein [Candidatus Lokiarchaeota archaeon]
MSERKWYHLTFSEESKKTRKAIATFLLILVILGYLGLIALNGYIIASAAFIRIYPLGFTSSSNSTSFNLTGSFIVQNDHWNSIDVSNINLNFSLFTDNNTQLLGEQKDLGSIQRLQNTSIAIDLFFNASEITPVQFEALNNTNSILFDVSLSFNYFLYGFYVRVKLNTTI